jgi:uncharacterized membrane protein
MKSRNQTALKSAFRASITLKGIDGALEAVGGLLLWLIHPRATSAIVRLIFLHEIPHDPHDFIRVHALRASETLLGSHRLFASVYLLSHGATKVALVVALWMNELWAYPATMIVFGAFSVYQMYRYSHTHSITMLVLTIFDLLLICLTWLEWRQQQAQRANLDKI